MFIQVSLAPVGTDKFSRLLQICHNCLAIILEVSYKVILYRVNICMSPNSEGLMILS